MSVNPSEKRRLPRFHITPCQYHDEGLNKNFAVQDISLGGLALRLVDRHDLASFAVGTEHHGIMKVEGVKLPCTFQVRHIRGSVIGGEWTHLLPELKEHLEKISHPRTLGSRLKPFDLQDAPDTIWYHNPFGVDLLFYLNDSRIHRWMLYIHQNFISWDEGISVRTGKTMAEDEEGYAHGIVQLETRLIDFDEQLDQRLVETAIDLIKSAPMKEESSRQLILGHLQGVI